MAALVSSNQSGDEGCTPKAFAILFRPLREIVMRRTSLTGLVFIFLLTGPLGCGDSEPKKVDENPLKARQEAQKDGGGLMPKGAKTSK